jgi:hypothetical protein
MEQKLEHAPRQILEANGTRGGIFKEKRRKNQKEENKKVD